MPLDATATEAAADAEAASTHQDAVVHITLKFQGTTGYDPSDIYDALNAQFGTVTTLKNSVARGTYNFLIAP